jgi:hypothetical protein
MATTKTFSVIDVIDLTYVLGGVDKQTKAAQLAIAQATSAMEDLAKTTVPKDSGIMQMLLQMRHGRSGAGPTPAPALPPTSTLSR